MDAIIYTSNTGSTKRYAELLAQETGLPVYPLGEAKRSVPDGAAIVYLGWIMAGSVKGYHEAAKRYAVRAVCAVGMIRTGTQVEDVRQRNHVPADVPVFTLQGGFDLKKLHGPYRLMMDVMVHTVGKSLANKPDRTPEEDEMLDMLRHGGDRVAAAHLADVLAWYGARRGGRTE